MQNSKYSKILTVALIIIVILIIGLLIFWGVSAINRRNIDTDAEEGIEAFNNKIATKVTPNKNNTTNTAKTENLVIKNMIDTTQNVIENEPTSNTSSDSTNSDGRQTYKGFPMVGYIEIPKTGKKMPILEEANKKALETSVAVLYGVGLNQVGNTVIVGHNYRNGTFFSDNYKLSIGDKIYITDENGTKLTYTIYKKYQTTPEDADYATRDTEGNIEITLSTCTDDSSARTVIWARVEADTNNAEEI